MCPALHGAYEKYCDPNDIYKWDTYWYQNFIVNCDTGEIHPTNVGGFINDDMTLMTNRYYDGYQDVISILDFSQFETTKKCPLMDVITDDNVDVTDLQLLGDAVYNKKYPGHPNSGQSKFYMHDIYDFSWYRDPKTGDPGVIVIFYNVYWIINGMAYNESDTEKLYFDKDIDWQDKTDYDHINAQIESFFFVKRSDGKLHLTKRERAPHLNSLTVSEFNAIWQKVGARYRLKTSTIPEISKMTLEDSYFGLPL